MKLKAAIVYEGARYILKDSLGRLCSSIPDKKLAYHWQLLDKEIVDDVKMAIVVEGVIYTFCQDVHNRRTACEIPLRLCRGCKDPVGFCHYLTDIHGKSCWTREGSVVCKTL